MAAPRSQRDEIPHRLLRARDWQDRSEFEELCQWWKEYGYGLCALVGIGGAGKTAIADRFLQVLPGGYPELPGGKGPDKDEDLPATAEPFIFSFYDVPNEDSFFQALTEWLSDVAADCRPAAVNPDAEKVSGGHIAQWLRSLAGGRERVLLVLDGLEKVQDDGRRTGRFGHIHDGRLRNLLLDTADGLLGRLAILVTTRFDLYDPLAERVRCYWRFPVVQLDAKTCADLFRARGVRERDDATLRRLAEEHGRHALTVDLIGGYIGEFCGGDISRLKPLGEIDLSDLDETLEPRVACIREQESRFARVAERYRESLRDHEPAALALLERLCLFRLGIDADTLASIFTGKDKASISGPTLASLTRKELDRTLDRLCAMKLVEKSQIQSPKSRISFSVHPAIRDGFLSGLDADAARQGHEAARDGLTAALPDELKKDGKDIRMARLMAEPGATYPSDPATLDLLEEIVYHTIESGHVPEAWDIHRNRIGGYRNVGQHLGAYERGERICRAFTHGEPPGVATSRPACGPRSEGPGGAAYPYEDLPEDDQAVFINEWALYLKDLGRLSAAARCIEFTIETRMRQEDWRNASRGSQNLTDVWSLSGHLSGPSGKGALATAAEGLRLAELADHSQARCAAYASGANAQALRGEVPAALADFAAALDWQHKVDGDDDPLYSLRGIRHSRVLARLGRREEAKRLTEANVSILVSAGGPDQHDVPQCHLILSALHVESGDLSSAESLCASARDWAVARDAKEVLCWSALAQARIELLAVTGQQSVPEAERAERLAAAGAAITEGLKIARDCGFGLYHIDLLLERARVHLIQGDPQAALKDLRLALDDGIAANEQTVQPELRAATHEHCGYAWAIAAGLHLRGEALLLQAAQALGSDSFIPAHRNQLPAEVREMIKQAESCLNESLDCWRNLRDPEPTEDNNFIHPDTGEEYNYQAAQTYDVLQGLAEGILTRRPPRPQEESTEPMADSSEESVEPVADAPVDANAAIDVGIIVALREEFRELFSQLQSPVAAEDPQTRVSDYLFRHESSEQEYLCAATFVGEMGPIEAALATERFLSRRRPATIVMLGIAAGIDDDVRLGDVILAKHVGRYLDRSKVVDGKPSFDIKPGGDSFPCSADLVRVAQDFEFAHNARFVHWQDSAATLLTELVGSEVLEELISNEWIQPEPGLHDGPIASGPVVAAAEEFTHWVKSQNRQYLALEMEGGGMLAAVYSRCDLTRTMMLRGISDFGDERKKQLDEIGKGGLRRYAMRNTISFLWQLLDCGLLPYSENPQ